MTRLGDMLNSVFFNIYYKYLSERVLPSEPWLCIPGLVFYELIVG